MGKTNLAPGFRFHPTDVELVRYYLKRKVTGKKLLTNAIAEIDIYKFEPPDLPDKSSLRTGDLKWYFFSPREKKYHNSGKVNRTTISGYWKTTGKDRDVSYNNEVVGKIKTLVFHYGKMPRGDRTDWVMHEYRLEDKALAEKNVPQDSYVLCVLFKKNGLGPRNGAQYGAPFNEEDWSDEEDDTGKNLVAIPSAENADLDPKKEISPHAPKDCFAGLVSRSCVFDVPPLTATMLPPLRSNPVSSSPLLTVPEVPPDDDELNSLLDLFVVDNDDSLLFDGFNYQNEVRHEPHFSVIEESPVSNYYGNSDWSDELFIELQDMIEPLTPHAQAGSHGDLRSNGQT